MKRVLFIKGVLTLLLLAISFVAGAKTNINKGTVTIYVGQEQTFYHNLSSTISVSSSGWFLRQTTGNSWSDSQEDWCYKIVSKNSQSCTIKGLADNSERYSKYELHFLSDNETYECYWTIIVKSSGSIYVDANPSFGYWNSPTMLNPGEKVYLTARTSDDSSASGAKIYYTTDGSEANENSILYTSAGITINKKTYISAIASKSGYSPVICGGYFDVKTDPIPVTNISLNESTISLVKDDTRQLRATISPSNATDKTVKWTSSNSSVASVSNDGLVTAVGRGSATITCKANDGSGVQATCDITVSSVKPWSRFTAKTTEGVEMTFYANNDGTCYVYGINSSPAIDVNTTGPITIPSEAEGLKVTYIGFSSFYNCKGITKVTIPNTVETIGGSAFYGCTALESVALGNGLKKLEFSTFYNCTSLTSVTGISQLEYIGSDVFYKTPWYDNLPDGLIYLGKVLYKYKGTMPDNTTISVNDGVKMISQSAFSNCKGLVGISIPQSIETIGDDLFYGCTNLTSITVASGNAKYDSRNNCNAIIDKEKNILIAGCKSSTFPSTVTTIGYHAFYGSGLAEIAIPNNVDSIANVAFSGCKELKTVGIGKGVRVIGNNIFYGCSALQSITVASSNPYYDSRDNCNAIIEKSTNKLIVGCTTTVIPQSVKAIGNSAFRTSDYDTYSITLPDQVEKIEESAFADMSKPRALTIGKGVKTIGINAFYGCNALRIIHVLSQEPVEIDETVFKSNYVYFPDSIYNNAVLYVPIGARINYMTTPCWNKFKHIVETDGSTPCEGDILELAGSPLIFAVTSTSEKTSEVIGVKSTAEGRISIPSQTNGCSVKGLGYRALYDKKGITHIDIPTSVTYLDNYALYLCSDLESVELPSSLERIGYFALGGLGKINNIVIPKSVKDIDRGIFSADSLLMSVTVESENPVYDSRGGCNAVIETATNTLVAGIQSTVIPNDIKTIGYGAFNSQKKMETMSIPNSVTCIDAYAFNNCGLKSITIPASVDSIGSYAFRYCRNLNTVTSLIENPRAINENIFYSDNVNSEWQFTSATLYVPIGCKEKYLNTDGWNKFKNIEETDYVPDPIIKGDVNDDGEVNGTDLVALTNIILGRKEKTEAADVNGDGAVNGTDYVALVNIILGRRQAPRKANTTTATSLSIDSSFDIKAGEEREMLINLTNPNDVITLVQFDLRLPSGLTLKQTDGEYDFDMAGRSTWRKHSLEANDMNGIIRFILASNSNTTLSGTEGAIIKMTIKADDSFTSGDILLENILMVTPDEKETKQGTYVYSVGSTEPPIQETTGLDFVTFDVDEEGDTELVIGLNNPDDEITLIQFDLSLPSGLTLKRTEEDYAIDIAGRTTWRKHSLDANATNGIVRFLLASSSNATLSGTEGAVIKMSVKTDKNFNSGTVRLDNILLVTPDEKEIKPSAISFVVDPVNVKDIIAEEFDKQAPIYNLSGQRLEKPRKGVNIVGGKKVLVK